MRIKKHLAYYEGSRNPKVDLVLFKQRVGKLEVNRQITEERLEDALRLSVSEYRKKYCTRKTYVDVCGDNICVNAVFKKYQDGFVAYSNFRNRVKTYVARLDKFGFAHDERIFKWAATEEEKDWSRIVGAGRAKPFKYTGKYFTNFSNRCFCTLYHFLLTVGFHKSSKLVSSRLKQKWTIDRALLESKKKQSRNVGLVYCITCSLTKKKYIGITCGSAINRFNEHVREASTSSNRILARAIRKFGAKAFKLHVLESSLPVEMLGNAEKRYIATLNTLHPLGLNANVGGHISHTAGKSLEIDGVTYESITSACKAISESTSGLVPPYTINRRILAGEAELSDLKKPCRRVSKHSEAGMPLFRRHKGLLKSNVLCERWINYDLFKEDVLEGTSFDDIKANQLILMRKNPVKKYSKRNFKWITKAEAIVNRCGRKVKVFGVVYDSVEAVARSFDISPSSLRYAVKHYSLSVEGAVSMILNRCNK